MNRRTKIISTIGPASQGPLVLVGMVEAGMDIARINSSHGSHEVHQAVIDGIRLLNQQHNQNVGILLDLEGYRIRIGQLAKPMMLSDGQEVFMIKEGSSAITDDTIPLEFEDSLSGIMPEMNIYVDDGMIQLKVIDRRNETLRLRVVDGGLLKSRKGVNIPDLKLPSEVLTAKDIEDIGFGIYNQVDYIAQSFVRNAHDISLVAQRVRPNLPQCKIIAKIENQDGLDHIDEIIDACDGIMVARGDLGVSLPMWEVPIAQKDIIKRCNKKQKMVITATQMLESMIASPRPTRAEVSDVANAILDGTDAVMLSAETAVGQFPIESIRMMHDIIEFTENYK